MIEQEFKIRCEILQYMGSLAEYRAACRKSRSVIRFCKKIAPSAASLSGLHFVNELYREAVNMAASVENRKVKEGDMKRLGEWLDCVEEAYNKMAHVRWRYADLEESALTEAVQVYNKKE